MKSFVSGRPYWWQWFTILSLDATAVGLTWQIAFARAAGSALRLPHQVVLAASIWCAYTADRWIEGWRLSPDSILTQRHHFSIRWRWPLAAWWVVVFTVDLCFASQLDRRDITAGFLLLPLVLLYVLSHQFLHRQHRWRLPKEVCVALLMAGGALVFVVSQPAVVLTHLIPLAVGLVLLCFTNCALISFWEREVDETQGQESLARRSGRFVGVISSLPWVVAASALVVVSMQVATTSTGLLCVALSAVLLGILDRFEPRMGRQLARVLADVALLTPLLFLGFSST